MFQEGRLQDNTEDEHAMIHYHPMIILVSVNARGSTILGNPYEAGDSSKKVLEQPH